MQLDWVAQYVIIVNIIMEPNVWIAFKDARFVA